MKVGIHQPNYIPWIGFFKKISMCDVFVFFDNIQMPVNKSFVSRNKIITNKSPLWLTVPIKREGIKSINQVEIADQFWRKKHLKTMELSYKYSLYFDQVIAGYKKVLSKKYKYLADLNIEIIMEIYKLLDKNPKIFMRASQMDLESCGSESIHEILEKLDTKIYVTGRGKGTLRYLDTRIFKNKNIKIEFCPDNFSQYNQKNISFVPNLSIMDVLFNVGFEDTFKLIDTCHN